MMILVSSQIFSCTVGITHPRFEALGKCCVGDPRHLTVLLMAQVEVVDGFLVLQYYRRSIHEVSLALPLLPEERELALGCESIHAVLDPLTHLVVFRLDVLLVFAQFGVVLDADRRHEAGTDLGG